MSKENLNVGIIGAGPAGISAAVQLSRSGFAVTVFEKAQVGGLIRNAWRVDNLPVMAMTPGPLIATQLADRLATCGAQLVHAAVDSVGFDDNLDRFIVMCPQGRFLFHTLLIASGTEPIPWPLLAEIDACRHEFIHHHVVDLFAAKKIWAILGGGDAAYDYALSLCPSSRVYILQRSAESPALPLLAREARARKEEIALLTAADCLAVTTGKAHPLCVHYKQGGRPQTIEVDGLVLAIGRHPTVDFIPPDLRQQVGKLCKCQRFFTIGDVNGSRQRQVALAMADGLRAAMDIAFAHAGIQEKAQ